MADLFYTITTEISRPIRSKIGVMLCSRVTASRIAVFPAEGVKCLENLIPIVCLAC